MVLVAYRHGRPAAELVDLRWEQVEFKTACCTVRVEFEAGTPSSHPILGDELRSLRRLQREQEPKSPFVFTSERGAPFTTASFARMVERAGSEAKRGLEGSPAHAQARPVRLHADERIWFEVGQSYRPYAQVCGCAISRCFEWEQGSVRSFIHCAARKLEAELMPRLICVSRC